MKHFFVRPSDYEIIELIGQLGQFSNFSTEGEWRFRLQKTPLLAFPKLMDFPLYMPCNDLLEIDFAEPGLRV